MPEVTQEEAQLVTLSRPDSHLVPLKANGDGQYVTTKSGKFMVSLKAVFRTGCGAFIGKLKESEVIFSRFVYIGTVYPDGSSLPFIPLANAEIMSVNDHDYSTYGIRQHPCDNVSTMNNSEPSFKVKVNLPESTWEYLHGGLLRSLASFKNYSITHEVQEGNERDDTLQSGKMCTLWCHVESDREVTVCLNGIWFTKRIKEVINRHDKVRGNVFLMPKITRTPASVTGELSFEIYGMWVTEDLENMFGPFHWQTVIY